MVDKKLEERNIPGMNVRSNRFAEVEHAEHIGATLRRITAYFARELGMVAAMLSAVIFGTLCASMPPACKAEPSTSLPGPLAAPCPPPWS